MRLSEFECYLGANLGASEHVLTNLGAFGAALIIGCRDGIELVLNDSQLLCKVEKTFGGKTELCRDAEKCRFAWNQKSGKVFPKF